jgi:protein-serine/threonine kinase
VRQTSRARAINEVVNALKPSATSSPDGQSPPLRVVNGVSTPTSSTITTAAQENIRVSSLVDGLPGRPGNSTVRWGGGLIAHPEVGEHEDETPVESRNFLPSLVQFQRKPITPSLATLEKAVAARIYFENLYFPLLRQPPSREQRRAAMERDMISMGLSDEQKEELRSRWRQNETDYLRDRRRKVDVAAFIKLKTIGHGWYLA